MHATFLICSERSGSNLITRMVDNHPQFCGPPPTHLIRLLVQHRLAYGDLAHDDNWLDLCADAAEILATQTGHWRTQPTAADLASAVASRTLPALIEQVLTAEARACGKERLFVKENHTYRFLPFLLATWPDARFVVLVRDPRDMALSWKRSPIHRGDVVRAARIWQADQAETMRAIAQLQDAGRVHRLNYEALVGDAASELDRLCGFLDAPFAPAMLAFHEDAATRANSGRTTDWQNLARPVLTANTRKYRDGLDAAEIAYVELVCRQEMEYFGYVLESEDRRSRADLEAELTPRERHEKPEYRQIPATERALRARRELLVRRLAARALEPVEC